MTKISDNPLNDKESIQRPHRVKAVTSGDATIAKSSGNQQHSRQARTLQRLYRAAGSWAQLASELGINRGLLWKVAHGQIQHSRKVGKALRRRFWQRLVRWFRAIPTGGAR